MAKKKKQIEAEIAADYTVSVKQENGEFKKLEPISDDAMHKLLGTEKEIVKAKITKDLTVYLEYSVTKEDGSVDLWKGECSNLAHEDLRNAFRKLVPHFVILCDMREMKARRKPQDYDLTDELLNVEVRSFSFDEGNKGITISGFKRIGNAKVLNMNTPFMKWDDQADPYEYEHDLVVVIEECKHEVMLYLDGKQAEKAQQELQFEETENQPNPDEAV